jgi:hypothetical protein
VGVAPKAASPFSAPPPPQPRSAALPSHAPNEQAYRKDAAAHLYSAYPNLVWHGPLPPLLYAVLVIETDIDVHGAVRATRIVRAPAAAREVSPWAMALIRRAAPLPPPRLKSLHYREIWLVHRSGRFQLDALTEGQT